MASSPPHPPLPLPDLLQNHLVTIKSLYTRLAPSPAPSTALSNCEDTLRRVLTEAFAQQRDEAEKLVREKEEELEKAWRKVNEWEKALGEEVTTARTAPSVEEGGEIEEGETLEELLTAVNTHLTSMRSRMVARGEKVAALHAKLREIREVLGKEWFVEAPYKVEEEGKMWEEMDLRGEVVDGLEKEVDRAEGEVAQRKTLISEHCTEIYTLRSELALPSAPHPSSSAPLPTPPSSAAAASSEGVAEYDPIDALVLAHLGVCHDGMKEIKPTRAMVDAISARRRGLESLKVSRNTTIQTTYDELYPLWTMLGVSEDEMELFVNRWMGSTREVVEAYQAELARMLLLKRQNLAAFICRERALLTSLWDQLYLSHPTRLSLFPSYSISVDPVRRLVRRVNAEGAVEEVEEEEVNENVTEGLLEEHERMRERVEREVEEARGVLERLRRYFEVVEKGRELEAAAADPSRLMDKSRGAAMRLAQEAKDRKRVDKEKPKLEAELRALIPQWEAEHGRPFLVNGVSFIEGLDEQIRAEEMEKENRKRAKQGLPSLSSADFASSSSARPLRAQHTGASSLSSSHSSHPSHTMAPLKRQMTGASVRSTASSTSAPPPAKRLARPPSRAALKETHATPSTTPAQPLKAQATGAAYGRARSGTMSGAPHSSAVAATPASAATSSFSAAGPSGMRIPVGWGAGAGHGAVAATPTPAAGGGGRLVPQMTGGGFRPRAT
ncbi:hypothetical protein JCM11251_002804 [Rhodosporidiobolus azoricus]